MPRTDAISFEYLVYAKFTDSTDSFFPKGYADKKGGIDYNLFRSFTISRSSSLGGLFQFVLGRLD